MEPSSGAPQEFDRWPRLMRAETAAAYLDEPSVRAFRRKVGTLYPRPIHVSGRGKLWMKTELDQVIERWSMMTSKTEAMPVIDAAAVL